MIEFYQQKQIDMLKLGCTLPNLANICLHKSTDSKFYPFTESDKDLLEKIREHMVGGPSIVFTRKAVFDETFIRKSTNLCKWIVGIDASQLYPCSMCQPMPTGLYTRWNYDSESQKFMPRQNKTWSFENMVLPYFQQIHPECRIESNVTTGRQKKIACFSVDGICNHCNTVFEAKGFYFNHCPCQESRPSLTDNEIMRGIKNREQDEMRKEYIQQKGYKIIEMWEWNWWELYRTDTTIKNHLRANFLYQRPLSEDRLIQEIKSRKLFGYVQCHLKVPEHLKANFANFPPIFKKTVVSRNDIGDLMKEHAEKEGIMSQPRRMLISSFHLKNWTFITPLLLYYLHLGFECTKIHRFIKYTPRKCFSSFVQSAVNARRKEDENPNSSVVAKTMKLLANSSYGYQIMDPSRHTVTKYLNDEKTHSQIINKLFKRFYFITDQLYEVELVKSEIEHREPIIVRFFILQYATLRMMELCYNFLKKFCDTEKFEELEKDTDSLCLALSEENLEDNILPEKRNEWKAISSRNCTDSFTVNATGNFFPKTCCTAHKTHDKREPGLFKEEFRCSEMLCLCSKTYCCYDRKSNKYKFISMVLNKTTLEDCGDEPMSKYRNVLEEAVNVTSI